MEKQTMEFPQTYGRGNADKQVPAPGWTRRHTGQDRQPDKYAGKPTLEMGIGFK
jgi:hypothetical protein